MISGNSLLRQRSIAIVRQVAHIILGLVLHELVVQIVVAEGQGANPPVTVAILRDAESAQGFPHRRPARTDRPGKLSDRQLLTRAKPFQV